MTANAVLTGIAVIFAMLASYELLRRDKPWNVTRVVMLFVWLFIGALLLTWRD